MNPYHDKSGRFSAGKLSGAARALKQGKFRGTSGELAAARQELASAALARADKTFDFVSRNMTPQARAVITKAQERRKKRK